jgi:formamidopyrimidine-DNA glycosylase
VPELVEVELSRQLAEGLAGRRISSLELLDPHASALGVDALRAGLTGATFGAPRRRGKLLLLDTDVTTLALHFGMTGRLVLDGATALDRLVYAPTALEERWLRFRLDLEGGGRLELHDPRRLARVFLDPDEEALGPDAAAVTLGQLRGALGALSTAPLKARLLNQARLAGVGNLIADEVLWRAGLSPSRRAGSLEDAELRRLHRHLRATISTLLLRGGSHTGDLMAARRRGGLCPRDGAPLRRETIGGRTTYWCPQHQR